MRVRLEERNDRLANASPEQDEIETNAGVGTAEMWTSGWLQVRRRLVD